MKFKMLWRKLHPNCLWVLVATAVTLSRAQTETEEEGKLIDINSILVPVGIVLAALLLLVFICSRIQYLHQ